MDDQLKLVSNHLPHLVYPPLRTVSFFVCNKQHGWPTMNDPDTAFGQMANIPQLDVGGRFPSQGPFPVLYKPPGYPPNFDSGSHHHITSPYKPHYLSPESKNPLTTSQKNFLKSECQVSPQLRASRP